MNRFPPRKLDPETVCTRVVARLIEEIACVDIAPDSPVWQDLTHGLQVVGELRVYRGRGRVQKVVSSRFALGSTPHEASGLDSHSVVVFTRPESAVPHFGLNSVRIGSRVHFHLDLLPKRDLAVAPAYLERCYGPLTDALCELERDARFEPARPSHRQRALLSPWHVSCTLDPSDLGAAEVYVDRYVSHWAGLLRSDAPELDSAPELALRDASYRKLLYSREVDPSWGLLDRVIGDATVDAILAALTT